MNRLLVIFTIKREKAFSTLNVSSKGIYDVPWFTYDEIPISFYRHLSTFIASRDWIKVLLFISLNIDFHFVFLKFSFCHPKEKLDVEKWKMSKEEKFQNDEFDLQSLIIKLSLESRPPWTFYHFQLESIFPIKQCCNKRKKKSGIFQFTLASFSSKFSSFEWNFHLSLLFFFRHFFLLWSLNCNK